MTGFTGDQQLDVEFGGSAVTLTLNQRVPGSSPGWRNQLRTTPTRRQPDDNRRPVNPPHHQTDPASMTLAAPPFALAPAPDGAARVKPDKPRPDFPLTAHKNGQWCKKIKGVVRMFGVWMDPAGAEALYDSEREDWE